MKIRPRVVVIFYFASACLARLGSLGHTSNPLGATVQAEWLLAEGEVFRRFGPIRVESGYIHRGEASLIDVAQAGGP